MGDGGGETFLAATGQFEPLNLGYLVGAMTRSITTLSIMILSIMALTIMGLCVTISINFQEIGLII